MGDVLAVYFIFQKLVSLWSYTKMNLRSPSFTCCIILYLFPFFSFCPFVFSSSKICGFASSLCMLCFLMRVPHFFPLQVLCSAVNHDLPMYIFWGVSVSNWYIRHLFNKLFVGIFLFLFEHTTTLLGAICPVRLFRNSKLLVQIVIIYGCYHPTYLLGKDVFIRGKLHIGVGMGYALLGWIWTRCEVWTLD